MAREVKPIAQQLRERKYCEASNIEWLAYAFLARLPFFGPKYHVQENVIDDINECKDACFVIWNHQSRRDYLFLKNLIAPKKFNMVAGNNEFYRKKFGWLFKHAHALPKKSFVNDPVGIRAMTTIIKNGGCVAFSPEGTSSIYGCQQPIVTGTGRFLQYFKKPVYLMKLEGAYLTSHKVDIKDRPGKVFATLSLLFKPEDLQKMTPQEIDDKINEAFWQDDYEWNKTKRIKYKTRGNPCKNLSDLIYKCPKCGAEFQIDAQKDYIRCTNCGNGCHMNDYYDVIPFDDTCTIPVSPTAWYAWQRIQIIKEIRDNPNYSIKMKVEVGELPKYKLIKDNNRLTVDCGKGEMTIDHQGIHFDGIKNGNPWQFTLNYSQYFTCIIENELDVIGFYIDDDYYEFKNDHKTGKVMLIIEEMHRLHFNTWKNFKWNNYMYHGTELEQPDDHYEENMKKLFINK